MSFVLTEDQLLLQRTAREFVSDRMPISFLRRLRETRDATGFSREAWEEMGSLGLIGIVLPEEVGGAGLGYAELGIVLQECGRQLSPTPFLSTVLSGANAVRLGGSEGLRRELLPEVCAGKRILALALEEGTRHAPYAISTRAEASGSGYRLFGDKRFVLDGHVADALVVVARTSGAPGERDGLTLFFVPAASPGVHITRTAMVDSRNAARVELTGVAARSSDVLGEVGRGAEILDALLDRAIIGLCAEMLGGAEEVFQRTVAYLKERRQFGVAIGSFQALKHRAAMIFCELELTKSIVLEALRAIDAGRADVPLLASAAKARATDTFLLAANEAIQMHGGIGVTDELDIGFFLKRARAAEMTFGGAAYHRDRFGRLQGY
jgi:alkylation response protein AidB-like acyl-CoA dehydrogenase